MRKKREKRILGFILSLFMVFGIAAPIGAETSRVETLLSNMTLRQKITQMLMVDFRYWDEDLTDSVGQVGFTKMNSQVQKIVEDYDFGSIIYFAQNLVGTEQSFQLSKDLQAAATKDNGIPLMISTDQEGGSVYRLGTGTALPGNMALGAASNSSYAEKAGEIIGSELSALGINTNLAPVVDVNNNANNPVIGLRSYSDDAETVGNLASATIKGLKSHNVIGCAKHFPGHGDTATDSHYGLPAVDKPKAELMENELKPYKVAIDQGIEMVMTAHILYPQLDNSTVYSNKTGKQESVPSTLSKKIITDLLKGEMGFDGVVVTDAMNMAGVAKTFDQVQAVILAFSAGIDMVCMPCVLYNNEDLKDLDAIINGVEKAVTDGEIPIARINDAVTRILTLKEHRGILDYNPNDYTVEKAKAVVGSKVNREAEREIAAAATTVIKNENNTLPLNLNENSKVLMLCPYDNEKAQMVMAWNRAKEAGLIPNGAQVDVYRFANATINATLKAKLDWADTVIINSEIAKASLYASNYLYKGPEAFVNYCDANNKTSVIMSVDKPYDVQMYAKADAILAVYGCKGSSVDVTEALTGGVTSSEVAYGPNIIAGIEVALGTFGANGKLPVNIPKLNSSSNAYTNDVLYARGYGLTYASKLNKARLIIAIEEAEKITENDLVNVVPVVVAEFKAALIEAKEIAANASSSQQVINDSFDRLASVMQKLSFFKGDKTQLAELVSKIEALDKEQYIPITWNNLEPIYQEAKKLLDNPNALEKDVNETHDKLVRSFLQLRLVPNKDLLAELIQKANGIDRSVYTETSLQMLETVLVKAQATYADVNASQEDVTNAETTLKNTIDNLILKDKETQPSIETPTIVKPKGETPAKPGVAKTGDTTSFIGTIGLLVSLSGILYFARKKKITE